MEYGPRYHEQISDAIRRAAEFCDCLQCFFVLHSMGGGECPGDMWLDWCPEGSIYGTDHS